MRGKTKFAELEELEAKVKKEADLYGHGCYNVLSADAILWVDLKEAIAQASQRSREQAIDEMTRIINNAPRYGGDKPSGYFWVSESYLFDELKRLKQGRKSRLQIQKEVSDEAWEDLKKLQEELRAENPHAESPFYLVKEDGTKILLNKPKHGTKED